MSTKTENVPNGFHNPSEPINSKLFPSEDPNKRDVSGSVMDGLVMDVKSPGYSVYKIRWLMLAFFVLYSASNSLQWTQYTIISDIIVKYYGVKSSQVSWTSMVYMVTYVPLIFPASWLLDRTNLEVCGSVMDGVAEKGGVMESPNKKSPVEYKVLPIRWLVLFIFVLYSASNSFQWLQYSIIQDAVVKHYGVTSITVYWTSMIYMITYIPLIFPGSYLLDKTGLRTTTIIGSFGTCAGAWLKVFSVPQDMFWLGFGGQFVVAVSQVFILNVPPRLAAVWFGADQVSSACSIGVFGNQLGVALGFLLPPMLVKASGSSEQIGADLQLMFYLVAGFTSVLFVFIVLFFKAAPPTPPSAAADLGSSLDSNFLQSIKKLLTNRNYVLLLISYGLNVGVFYAISTLLNELVLNHYPGANEDAGRIGLVLVVAGMAGSVVSGLLLDRTHRFKETTLALYGASVVGMLVFTFTLDCGYIAVVYFSSILLGFFMTGYLPVGFEFASEVTYPEPEGTTSGILNACVQVFGIVLTLLFEWMLGAVGDRWSNLTLCLLLALGTGVTAAIRPDLRRQAAMNKA